MAEDDFDRKITALMRRFEKMPAAVRKAAGQEAFLGAEDMAAQMRLIAPYDATEDGDQHVRDHIRVEEGRLGDVSYVVIADAKDAKNRPKAPRVELGHTAEDGTQVPAEPFFYPVARANRRRIARKITTAMRRALREEARK